MAMARQQQDAIVEVRLCDLDLNANRPWEAVCSSPTMPYPASG